MDRKISFCVLTKHTAGTHDSTPCRIVSDEVLTRYIAAEAELQVLKSIDAVRVVMWLRRLRHRWRA
jgi:hypothetical protein